MQISIANIIRGTLIGNTMSVLTRYISRVVNGGGIVESPQCVETALNSQGLLQQASLLVVPSGYKGGTLYSEIPTNGNGDLTWTRGSDAFRTNASGVLQRVPWNLLSYSEEFSNAYWTKSASTLTANVISAPNGTLTADQLNEAAVSTPHGVFPSSGANVIVGQSYVMSMYVKKGNRSYCGLEAFYNTSNGAIAFFNLDNGTLLYQFAQGSGYSITNSSITNVGNDWYLLRGTFTVGAVNGYFGVCMASTQWTTGTSYNNTYLGDTSKFIYIWGAQLVEGTTAQTYLPTTDRLNFPRLSYMYGSCPSALLEPQRTNVGLWSQDLDNASWGKVNSSVTANSTTSPDGTTNADTFTGDGTNNQHYIVGTTSGNITSGTTYTYSIYAKKNTNNFIQLWISNTFGGMFANFDLNNGVVGTLGIGSGGSNPTSSIQSVGNGWYRCSMTFVPTSTGAVGLLCIITTSASAPRSEGNTLSTSVFLWGAQLEQGAYPTTYIPTTSATATRVADSFSRNNIYTNGLISASGGTWFVELRGNVAYTRDAAGAGLYLDASVGLASGFAFRTGSASSRMQIWKAISSVATMIYTTTTDTTKSAIKWDGSTADVFANGVKVVSATSFTPTNMENLNSSATDLPKFIQQMALFPTPLSDTDCTTLNTL